MTTTFDLAQKTAKTVGLADPGHKASILTTALTIFTNNRAATERMFEEYEADVRYYHFLGYRAHYCPHGTNNWTDYDNICGGCEDGLTTLEAYMPLLRQEAIAAARRFWTEVDELVKISGQLDKMKVSFDFGKAFKELTDRYKII